MAAIGRAASEGALVREGDALERLAEADRIAFDKTGTLTEGRPRISAVLGGEEMSEADVSDLAAAAESLSEHPLGRTIAAGRTVFGRFGRPEDFRMSGGSGVRARIPVEGGGMIEAAVGRLEWLVGPQVGAVMSGSLADQAATLREGGATLAGVAADGRVVGLIALSRRMMRMIRFNITLAMGINFAAILLAATGLMGPVAGALVHNAGSVAVILNSARLLGRRREAN